MLKLFLSLLSLIIIKCVNLYRSLGNEKNDEIGGVNKIFYSIFKF